MHFKNQRGNAVFLLVGVLALTSLGILFSRGADLPVLAQLSAVLAAQKNEQDAGAPLSLNAQIEEIIGRSQRAKKMSGDAPELDSTLIPLLEVRAQTMRELAKTDPQAFLFSTLPIGTRRALPQSVQSRVEQSGPLAGTLEVLHVDDFEHYEKSYFRYFLNVTSGGSRRAALLSGQSSERIELFPTETFTAVSGTKVRFKNAVRLHDLAVADVSAENLTVVEVPKPDSVGEQKMLVLLVTTPGFPAKPFTKEEAYQKVFNSNSAFQRYYDEQSYQKVSFTGEVYGWVDVKKPDSGECTGGVGLWHPEIQKYISDQAIDLSVYDRVLFIPPVGYCSFVGKGENVVNDRTYKLSQSWVGTGTFISDQNIALNGTLAHEIGHALGVMHANGLDCGTDVLRGACTHIEYGNPFDVMGGGSGSAGHFNALYKSILGWIPPREEIIIDTPGRYTLNPLESEGSLTKIAKIKSKNGEIPFALEYRQSLGFDRINLEAFRSNQNGVFVYEVVPETPETTRLLDMNPLPVGGGWWQRSSEATLNGGQIFSDPDTGITIGPIVSSTPEAISFDVDIVSPKCEKHPPFTRYFYPKSGQTVNADRSLFVSFGLENKDASVCASRLEFDHAISGIPDTWKVSPQEGENETPLPREVARFQFKIDVPPDAPIGQYTLRVDSTRKDTGEKISNTLFLNVEEPLRITSVAPRIAKVGQEVSLFTKGISWRARDVSLYLYGKRGGSVMVLFNPGLQIRFVVPDFISSYCSQGNCPFIPTPAGKYTIGLYANNAYTLAEIEILHKPSFKTASPLQVKAGGVFNLQGESFSMTSPNEILFYQDASSTLPLAVTAATSTDGSNLSFRIPSLESGRYFLVVNNNVEKSDPVAVDIIGAAKPVIETFFGPAQVGQRDVVYTWTLTATDPDSTAFSYSIDWGDGSGTQGRRAYSKPGEVQEIVIKRNMPVAGVYPITIRLMDDDGVESIATTTLDARDAPISILSPAWKQVAPAGKPLSVRWLSLKKDTVVNISAIHLESKRATPVISISSYEGENSYTWTVPSSMETGTYALRFQLAQGSSTPFSSGPSSTTFDGNEFTIGELVEFSVSLTETPSLKLILNDKKEEEELIADFSLSFQGGKEDTRISRWIYAGIRDEEKQLFGSPISAEVISSTGDIITEDATYRIPARKKGVLRLRFHYNPRQLFAGTYRALIESIYLRPDWRSYDLQPRALSNPVTIIGEVAPYIMSMGPRVKHKDTLITVHGVRFAEKENILVFANKEGTKELRKPSFEDGTVINFTPSEAGLTDDWYSFVVINEKLGRTAGLSNAFYFRMGDAGSDGLKGPRTAEGQISITPENAERLYLSPLERREFDEKHVAESKRQEEEVGNQPLVVQPGILQTAYTGKSVTKAKCGKEDSADCVTSRTLETKWNLNLSSWLVINSGILGVAEADMDESSNYSYTDDISFSDGSKCEWKLSKRLGVFSSNEEEMSDTCTKGRNPIESGTGVMIKRSQTVGKTKEKDSVGEKSETDTSVSTLYFALNDPRKTQYQAVLSASATNRATGEAVPCPSIRILDKALSADCTVTLNLKGSSGSYDVTPKTKVPHYTYDVNLVSFTNVSELNPTPPPAITPLPLILPVPPKASTTKEEAPSSAAQELPGVSGSGSRSEASTYSSTPSLVQVPTSSAVIIAQYVKHVENWSFICRDASKCSADSTNSSGMNSYTVTAKTPYTFEYYEFSGNEIFTPVFAERYGITGSTYSGFFDEKTNKGSITKTATGPKGVSRTEEVFSPPPYFRTDVSDNVKGSDTSSSWTDSIDGISIDGKWESYSYSGDSKKYLVMSGPSNRTYTVSLSLGARDWRLNTARDSGPDFNPRYLIDGDEIACRSIKVMGKVLDKNCRVKISVSGGGVYDITPVVSAPRYLYSKPFIVSIEDTTPTSSPTPTPTPTSRDSSRNSSTPSSAPAPSSTPIPTATPVSISVSVSPSVIKLGESATITWSVTGNPRRCSNSWSGSGEAQGAYQGTHTVSPSATTAYLITCFDQNGGSITKEITLKVEAPSTPERSRSSSPSTSSSPSPTPSSSPGASVPREHTSLLASIFKAIETLADSFSALLR